MCGIFGVTVKKYRQDHTEKIIHKLYRYSETRGKEASGAIFSMPEEIDYIKTPYQASKMLKTERFQKLVATFMHNLEKNDYGVFIGHSRLVTNGSSALHENNQPIYKGDVVGVHNGIVVNDDDIWAHIGKEKKAFDVDTESVVACIDFYKHRSTIRESVFNTFALIEGVANIATVFADSLDVVLATNNGSLYYTVSCDNDMTIFASERYIVRNIIKELRLDERFPTIRHLRADTGLYIGYTQEEPIEFSLTEKTVPPINEHRLHHHRTVADISDKTIKNTEFNQPFHLRKYDYCKLDQFFYPYHEKIQKLKRCSRCVLPETMPFIDFDDNGVCNYCRHYKKLQPKGKEALLKAIEKYRKNNGSPDCLMTFSGGRDSSYALHYAKKELGLNPVAYTYDWGVITDLGRRNQSRMCQKLGIEHIIVSADIKKKRKFIKQNVEAWLKKPDIGMVPLFMAGDKQYFYYANKVAKQNNLDLIFLNGVALEQTHFKAGFCGVRPKLIRTDDGIARLTDLESQIKLMAYYAKEYAINPSYINSSLIDTIGAFFSYYIIPHNYVRFFQYIPWNEKEIEETLLAEYDWETLPGHNTTWRIGDGTSHFYNYIYYLTAGLTENDTFRSNQIREGMLTRDEAMRIVQKDNMPQWEAIQWYCETMGLDFVDTIEKINAMRKLYSL